MRGKSLELTALFLTILIVILGISPAFSATGVCPIDAMNYEPASTTWTTPAHSLGDIFNITVMAYNLTDFRIWSTGIKYDPAVLNWTGYTWGDMDNYVTMHAMLGYMPGTVNTTTGESTAFAQTADTGQSIATMASLLLITHHFEVVGYGTTAIEHYPVPMCNVANIEDETYYGITDFPIANATFTMTPPPPYAPMVDFTWPAGTYYENDNVTFTATSDPGYEQTAGFLEVMNYTWDFGDGTGTVFDDKSGSPGADSVVTHNFTAAATRTVNVTVQTANNPGGDEYETASAAKDIIIWARVFSYVDVVTIKTWLGNTTKVRVRGDAADMPGSAFAPGETVTLVTEAKYLGLPVISLNVGFQVNKPVGSMWTYLSKNSNVTGEARVSFRVPQAPLPDFGAYEVISTARMFEEDFSDTLKFYVGWIVEIDSVTCETDPIAKGAQARFNVTVTHYDPYDAYPVVLTVNAFDSLAQAIGSDSLAFDIAAAGTGTPGTAGPSTTTTYLLYITIPTGAWPGGATVKANAYTDYPQLGGTAYCPEEFDTFNIVL